MRDRHRAATVSPAESSAIQDDGAEPVFDLAGNSSPHRAFRVPPSRPEIYRGRLPVTSYRT
jgi:hypothetical protein